MRHFRLQYSYTTLLCISLFFLKKSRKIAPLLYNIIQTSLLRIYEFLRLRNLKCFIYLLISST